MSRERFYRDPALKLATTSSKISLQSFPLGTACGALGTANLPKGMPNVRLREAARRKESGTVPPERVVKYYRSNENEKIMISTGNSPEPRTKKKLWFSFPHKTHEPVKVRDGGEYFHNTCLRGCEPSQTQTRPRGPRAHGTARQAANMAAPAVRIAQSAPRRLHGLARPRAR